MGGLDVRGYHAVNLLIHLLNASLVYLLVILTFRTPFFRSWNAAAGPREHPPPPAAGASPVTYHRSQFIALFASLLFVSHPVQTQAVTYIVQRFTSLATLFYLLSIVTYIKGRLLSQSAERKAHGAFLALTSTLTLYVVSLLSAVCAMKTKEIAFTLPLMILLYEFSFFRTPLKKKLLFMLPVLLTLLIIPLSILGPVSYIGTNKPLGELLSDLSEKTRIQTDIPRGDYLLTQARVITTYLRLLFFPANQNLDYDYPIYRSFFTPPVLLSCLLLLSLFGAGLYLFYASRIRVKDRTQSTEAKDGEGRPLSPSHLSPVISPPLPCFRLIGFGILWFFITLSVESSVIPIVDVIFEHRVYLPSVGFFIAITTLMFLITNRLKRVWHSADRGVCAIIVIVLTCTTYARNIVWQDEGSLWEDVIEKSPKKGRGHYNLGIYYYDKGDINSAIQEYKTAITLNPFDIQAYNNLGNAYAAEGEMSEAVTAYHTALKFAPQSYLTLFNLANTYADQGRLNDALDAYQAALKIKPRDAESHNNLGGVYFRLGRVEKAIEEIQIALKIKPDYAEAQENLEFCLKELIRRRQQK